MQATSESIATSCATASMPAGGVRRSSARCSSVAMPSALFYDPIRDLLVLIEQFRVGAFIAGREPGLSGAFSPWLIEIVAGIIDQGQTAEEVARREAIEEAGCKISHIERIGIILTSPGGSSETVEFYLGLTHAPETGGIHGLDDEHEDIRVIVTSPEEVYAWIDTGRIVNGPALVGLQWFRVHHQQLRERHGRPAPNSPRTPGPLRFT